MNEPGNSTIPSTPLFDHSGFVALRETLLDLLDQRAEEAAVDARLEDLLRHMQQQFAAEEAQMLATQFPPFAAHKREHDRALDDFSECVAKWQSLRDRAKLLDYLENGLADWFVKHVNTRDFITARFIANPAVRRSPLTVPAPD
ncbi:MAG: hemerythrin family protein [Gallionella sp.]|nr:hemerythrin family protein [Gallionella sp.]